MIKLRDDIIFEDPQSRIREYCAIEIYHGYDNKHSIDDEVSQEDIATANELYAMIDRYDKGESRRLLSSSERISTLLSMIPDMEISAASGEKWLELKGNIRRLLVEFLSVKGIGLAKATKILHLKRPRLFPVLDSFVIKFLLGINMSVEKSAQLDMGMQALELARMIMADQKVEFEKLIEQTRDLPISLTPVRMFDILCWTAEKWDVRGILKAPYGVPYNSLLAKFQKDAETTSGDIGPRHRNEIPKSEKRTVYSDDLTSSAKSIIASFIVELSVRADFGIRGEKPLAVIAALKYLSENKISGKTLTTLLHERDAKNVRSIFIDLAKQHSHLKDPSNSWNVITGKNKELQYAIQEYRYGDVNKAFSKLTLEETEALLNKYMGRLDR